MRTAILFGSLIIANGILQSNNIIGGLKYKEETWYAIVFLAIIFIIADILDFRKSHSKSA